MVLLRNWVFLHSFRVEANNFVRGFGFVGIMMSRSMSCFFTLKWLMYEFDNLLILSNSCALSFMLVPMQGREESFRMYLVIYRRRWWVLGF